MTDTKWPDGPYKNEGFTISRPDGQRLGSAIGINKNAVNDLWASAPELYEALDDLSQHMEITGHEADKSEWYEKLDLLQLQAREALKKARGET